MKKSKNQAVDFKIVWRKNVIALICFFLSGFTGIVYEICWIRKSSLVFGNTIFAVSTVVSLFFCGLAIGSYLFGRLSLKESRPVRLYSFLEIGVGFFAVFTILLFNMLQNLYTAFYPLVYENFFILSLIRFLLITIIVLPPAVLMGGTLPLFCRQYVNREERIGFSVGLLYALNTLGAVIGALICGFFMLRHLGINSSIFTCGIVNVFIGIIAGRLRLTALSENVVKDDTGILKQETSHEPPGVQKDNRRFFNTIPIVILFFFTGFAALGNEIIWIRYLTLIIHNTVYTYTITFAFILTGIVLGSLIISPISDRVKDLSFTFGILSILTGLSVMLVLFVPAFLWDDFIDTQNISQILLVCVSIFLIPSVLSGSLFPLAIRMVVRSPLYAGIGVGKMTAVNTIGGVLGSLCIGFFSITLLGIQNSIMLTTGISVCAGIAAVLFINKNYKSVYKISISILALLLWCAIPAITGTSLPKDFLEGENRLVDFREGINSNLAVVKWENINTLEINRLWQGEQRKSHQIMAAHIPMIMHSAPKDVAVIGIGVGQTASRFLYYDIDRLDCIDIEPELFDIIRKYFNANWLDDPRVNVIVEDGRNYFSGTNKKYDLVSIEIGQMFRPSLASFYTEDFYRIIREKMNPGGVVCQFVPLVFLDIEELLSVIRTFIEVFPESILWYNRYEFLITGSVQKKLKLTKNRIELIKNDSIINNDLEYFYWGGYRNSLNIPEVFAAGFLCGKEGLKGLTKGASVYNDDKPVLEYEVSKKQRYHVKNIEKMLDRIKKHIDPVEMLYKRQVDDSILAKVDFIRDYNLKNIIAMDWLRQYVETDDVSMLKNAVRWNPYNSGITYDLGIALVKKGKYKTAERYFRQTINLEPDNLNAHNNIGYVLAKMGKYQEAIKHYKETIRIKPDNEYAYNNIGVALAKIGKTKSACEYFSKAIEINPEYKDAKMNLKKTEENILSKEKGFTKYGNRKGFQSTPLREKNKRF